MNTQAFRTPMWAILGVFARLHTALPLSAVVVLWPILLAGLGRVSAHEPGYTRTLLLEECDGFSPTGRHPFFILEPGHQLMLEGEEDGESAGVTITVLHQTKRINGIETRVVKERHTQGGKVVELSWNYVALCNRDNSVVYFGEDVNIFHADGRVTHDGAWRAGVQGARAGILMPGTVLVGARYLQEIAPGVALDQAEIVSLTAVVRTPAGRFAKCLQTRETTPLEPGVVSYKWYAPGIGLVQDGPLHLVRWRADATAETDEQ